MVKNFKRFLCFLCCLALILALVPPLPASAAVASDHVIESSGDGFALYNGVKLPNIDSVWTDKESYPYAVIYAYDNEYFAYLFSSVSEPYVMNSANDLVIGVSNSQVAYAELSNGSWTISSIFPSSSGFFTIGKLITWASFDIFDGQGSSSVYLSATSPIPLDGLTVIEWDGDTTGLDQYGSLLLYRVADYVGVPSSYVVVNQESGILYWDSVISSSDTGWFSRSNSSSIMTISALSRPLSGVSPGLYFQRAADSYTRLFAYSVPVVNPFVIDGLWFMETPASGDDFTLSASFSCEDANFSGSGISYDASSRQLTYIGNANDVVVWTERSGWISQDYQMILFDDDYSLDETAFAWWVSNAVLLQDASGDVPNYTSVTIGDQSYYFWSYDQANYSSSPDVTLTVDSVGSKMEFGLRSKIWTYSGDTAFQGFASQSDGEVAYSPGSTYTLAGVADQTAAYTLYPVSELPALSTTVFIDGVEHIFTGDSTELSPLVQLIVAEDTITLAGASGTYTFTPPEGNIFLGLAPSSSVDPTYPIGTYTLGQQDTNSVYTLYTVLESLGPLLNTDVNVYSNSGITLHDSYAASGYGTAPTLTLTILDNGLQISNSAGVVSSWTAADPDFFLGFAMQRNAITPSFRPGQSFTIGGGSTDVLTDLYVVYSPGYSDINDFEVSSWLVSAVGGFLDFQLWPGMSLNEVMWIILVAGVLFWFLKLTI